ncbi:16567_t:CDS:2 [Entrophospora sp. SA101]|nr:16567_t:CDS:2 [Entrophospora sp. SA101]
MCKYSENSNFTSDEEENDKIVIEIEDDDKTDEVEDEADDETNKDDDETEDEDDDVTEEDEYEADDETEEDEYEADDETDEDDEHDQPMKISSNNDRRFKGESHLELAGSIYDLVLQPLLKYSEEHNKRLKSSNEEITGYLKLFDKMSAEVEKARVSYVTKCQLADELKEKADREAEERQKLEITSDKGKQQEKEQQASMKAAVVLGDQAFTELEIMKFLERMRDEIESQEVRIPFLGVYNDVYSGEDITRWLQENHPTADSWREAESIGQDLADQGFIKLVGAYGNRFTGSPSSYFQWKKKSFDLKETEDTVIKTKGWSFPTITSSSQPPDKRARREADEADEAYRHAVRRLDRTRLYLEECMI